MRGGDYNVATRESAAAGSRAKVTPVTAGPSTLLVCTANICRSPMAEVMWRAAAHRLRRLLPVMSAGIEARPGTPPDPMAVELMAERGLDLTGHRARRFQAVSAMRHELVLVMEPEHQRRVLMAAPALAGRVHLLGRWGAGTIEDPYGASRPAYDECLGRLERSVIAWMNRIVNSIDANRIEQ